MECVLKNSETDDIVEINVAVPSVVANGDVISGISPPGVHLVFRIALNAPNVVPYDKIIDSVLKHFNVGGPDYEDAVRYIHKKKCQIERRVCKQYRIPLIFETVRSIGYRLHRHWQLIKSPSPGTHSFIRLVDSIGDVLNRACDLQAKMAIKVVKEPDSDEDSMVLDVSGFEDEVSVLEDQFGSLTEELLGGLNLTPLEFRYVVIQSVLRELYSYVTMARRGSGISEQDWHDFFYREVKQKFEHLVHVLASG